MIILSKDTYISVLTDSDLNLVQKQTVLESYLTQKLSYSSFRSDTLDTLNFSLFYSTLKLIDWTNFSGKTYFNKFFKLISLNSFIDYILIDFFTQLKFVVIETRSFLQNLLCDIIKVYFKQNFISFDLLEIERTSAYFIEVFLGEGFFTYDFIKKNYNLNPQFLLINIEYLCTIVKFNWPLVIPAQDYVLVNNNYIGGYYNKNNLISLNISNLFDLKPIIISDYGLNVISKLQHTKFILVNNLNIKKLILFYFQYLNNYLNTVKEYSLEFLHNYYASYQYLIFIESNITEIYYPFQINSLGSIQNSVNFGLTLNTNKLSRYLVGLGKSSLNETTKNLYETYIVNSLNIDLKNSNQMLINSLDELNILLILEQMDFKVYSIENFILLADWFYNVLVYNITEISCKLNIFDNNFKIISLLSNDYNGLMYTNLIDTNNSSNIYDFLYNKLKNKFITKNYNNWISFITRPFLDTLINTVIYSKNMSKSMLYNSFKNIYFKNNIISFELIELFVSANIFKDTFLTDEINHISSLIKKYSIENDSLTLNILEKNTINYKVKEVISKFINTSYKKIMLDLSDYFFKKILIRFNEIIDSEFLNISNFISYISNLNMNYIVTAYFTVSLQYLNLNKEEFKINNGTYIKFLELDTINLELTKDNFILNFCKTYQSAIIHDIIYKFSKSLYFIDNFVFFKFEDFNLIINQINNSFNSIYQYNYVLHKDYFNDSKIYKLKFTYKDEKYIN